MRFLVKEDYNLVLEKCPWFIGEHFLSIRPWVPNFKPFTSDVSSITIDVEKPLITVLFIGNFEQPIIYEGIHKLCFSCGCIGHQKDACPHIIRPAQPPCKEETEEGDKAQSNPCERHAAESAADQHPGTSMDQNGIYRPWMVVTRKKSG
uniref:CCHC-type domain-containing protein n=1 Tax=Quercus lobata TaxID=97700 RepID=A0A7N2KPV1_QUELO